MVHRLAPLLVALAIWVGTTAMYMAPIYPASKAVVYPIYEDDGVYVGASQLVTQGIVPYRDFFFPHPPLASVAYVPAVSYHFTPWGSTENFVLARYWSSFLAASTVALIFVGAYLATRWWYAALAAAMAAAVDSSLAYVARQTLLDVPMMAMSALSATLVVIGLQRSNIYIGAVAGLTTGLAILVKLPALGLMPGAIIILWRCKRHLAAIYALTATVTVAIGFGIAVSLAGITVINQVFAYQMLRPEDGTVGLLPRLLELSKPVHRQVLLVLALTLAGGVISGGSLNDLTFLSAVWSLTTLGGLLLSRSFYPHYIADLIPPTYLGAAAAVHRLRGTTLAEVKVVGLALVILIVGLPGFIGLFSVGQDRIYEIVSRYIRETTSEDDTVLTLNPLFAYLAGRPIPEGAGWTYMLDSYGSLVYTGLKLPPPQEAKVEAWLVPSPRDVWDLVRDRRPQELITSRLGTATLVVVDAVGSGRLSDTTRTSLTRCFDTVEERSRYVIYRAKKDTKDCVSGSPFGLVGRPLLVDPARTSGW